MQTIFLATDKSTGDVWLYENAPGGPDDIGDYDRIVGKSSRVPRAEWLAAPGECREYRLVRVDEADDKDARIAELETKLKNAETYGVAMADDNRGLRERIADLERKFSAQKDLGAKAYSVAEELATRSPGVMAECVENLLNACQAFEGNEAACIKAIQHEAQRVREHYATAGHRWELVDDEHPITSEDAGRMFCWGPTRIEHVFGNGPKFQAAIEGLYILRPVAPPFVFDGTPGRYRLESGEKVDVETTNSGRLLVCFGGKWIPLNSDGTFPGGRIVGRVGE